MGHCSVEWCFLRKLLLARGCGSGEANLYQIDSDGDCLLPGAAACGDVCDPCPGDPTNTCTDSAISAPCPIYSSCEVDISTESVSVLAATWSGVPISITEGAGNFTVEASQVILQATLGPEGMIFGELGRPTVTFSWSDADDDGLVDGTDPPVSELELRVWKDGLAITGECGDPRHQPGNCYLVDACCDTAANTWTIELSSFSEFVVGVLRTRPVAGLRIVLKDKDANPSRRKLTVVAKDEAIVPPVPGSGGDPTVHGARVLLANPVTGELDEYLLPASGWVGLGTPAGSRGYKYTDKDLANGPCKKAVLRPGKLGKLVARCGGSQMNFDLDEPSQAALVATFQPGSDPALCAAFGGDVAKNVGILPGKTGLFKSRKAPPPASCPLP